MSDIEPLTCAETFRRLDDYLDRELAPEELERVRQHLETCAVCADEYRYEASVIREVRGKLQRIAVPPDLHARVWRNVTRARAASPPLALPAPPASPAPPAPPEPNDASS